MSWIYLILAGLFEIGWPIGLKMAQEEKTRVLGIGIALVFMTISGFMLWLAQRQIAIGTSYAVWTGIGAAGTFVVGVLFYGDPTRNRITEGSMNSQRYGSDGGGRQKRQGVPSYWHAPVQSAHP